MLSGKERQQQQQQQRGWLSARSRVVVLLLQLQHRHVHEDSRAADEPCCVRACSRLHSARCVRLHGSRRRPQIGEKVN